MGWRGRWRRQQLVYNNTYVCRNIYISTAWIGTICWGGKLNSYPSWKTMKTPAISIVSLFLFIKQYGTGQNYTLFAVHTFFDKRVCKGLKQTRVFSRSLRPIQSQRGGYRRGGGGGPGASRRGGRVRRLLQYQSSMAETHATLMSRPRLEGKEGSRH